MKNDNREELLVRIREDSQHLKIIYDAAVPRRYLVPQGYTNPAYYSIPVCNSVNLFANLTQNSGVQVLDYTNSVLQSVCSQLVLYKVPTFFVGQEFAEAVSESNVESDMMCHELFWPDHAMLFVLPDKFILEFFGGYLPLLAVAHKTQKELREQKAHFADHKTGIASGKTAEDFPFGHDYLHYQWFENTRTAPIDYVSSWRSDIKLSYLLEATAKDTPVLDPFAVARHGGEIPSAPNEMALMAKVQRFFVQLMLGMTCEKQFITRGILQRPEKFKRGQLVKEALWHPNFIGLNYHHPEPAAGDGTHASPRLHRRRGHFRDQHYGIGNTSIKRIWIKPTWVSAQL